MRLTKFVAASVLALSVLAVRDIQAACAPAAYSPCPPPGTSLRFDLPSTGTSDAYSPLRWHPVIADLGLLPGHKQIIFGTTGGRLWVVNDDGTIPTGFPLTIPNNAAVRAGPAVGDLSGDGLLDIVVAWGTLPQDATNPGGFGAFFNNGPGKAFDLRWQRATFDKVGPVPGGPPDGIPDGAISTPAIGDLDGDGKKWVVVGTLDEHIYAVDGLDGSNKPGWPFWVGDVIFSSPALADLDGDGKLEVIIGTESHYQPVMPPGVGVPGTTQGGLLVVLNSSAVLRPGFPLQLNQVIHSAPVVGDIDGDGRPEIVFGTGSSWAVPQSSHRVYAVHCDGTPVAGWPVHVDGQVFTAPALGDLDGDGLVDVVVTDDNTGPSVSFHVYAFKGNGTLLWSRQPRGLEGETLSAGDPVIADVLSDGHLEVLVPQNAEIVVFSSTGVQLTDDGTHPAGGFSFHTQPLFGGVSGLAVDVLGGKATVTTFVGNPFDSLHGSVFLWQPKVSPAAVPWGMFHRDAAANGRAPNAGTCAPRTVVPTRFYSLSPCRVIDTRVGSGALGGPALLPNSARNFSVLGVCGIPSGAVAISVNLTVTNVQASGELVVYPADVSRPGTSAISFQAGRTRGNNAIVYLSAATTTLSVFDNSIAPVDIVVDVNGYFFPFP
jgi:FG-GAP-like repeat